MNDPVSPEPARETQRFLLRNVRDRELTVVLEPWASEYVLAPRDVLEIVEEGGDPAESMEIEIEASRVVFYGRSRSILRAFRDGVELP